MDNLKKIDVKVLDKEFSCYVDENNHYWFSNEALGIIFNKEAIIIDSVLAVHEKDPNAVAFSKITLDDDSVIYNYNAVLSLIDMFRIDSKQSAFLDELYTMLPNNCPPDVNQYAISNIYLSDHLDLFSTMYNSTRKHSYERNLAPTFLQIDEQWVTDSAKTLLKGYNLFIDVEKIFDKLPIRCIIADISETMMDLEFYSIEKEAALILYELIKNDYYEEYNNLISSLIMIALFHDRELENNEKISSDTAIAMAIATISESKDEDKDEVIDKVVKIFSEKIPINIDHAQKYFNYLTKNKTKNDAINYLVKSIESYEGRQGYYEYYGLKYGVVKLHYSGNYIEFSLNTAKSLESGKLMFDVKARADIEAPYSLSNREEVIDLLFKEIQKRSYKDVIEAMLKNIKEKAHPYYNIDDLEVEFEINWTVSISTDIDY